MRTVLLSFAALATLCGSTALRADPPAAPPPPPPAPPAPVAVAPGTSPVFVAVHILDLTPRAAAGLRSLRQGPQGAPVACDPAVFGRALVCWGRADHLREVTAPRLLTLPGREGTVTVGQDLTYVRDYDLQEGNGATIAEPILGTVWDGLLLKLTATPRSEGVDVAADLALSEVKLPMESQSVLLPRAGQRVTLQTPEVHTRRLERRLRVPAGTVVLLGDLPGSAGQPGRVTEVWVEARVLTEAPAAAPVVPPAPVAPR